MSATKTIGLGLGDFIPTNKVQFYNRTGATLKRGQFASVDLLGTQGESTSIVPAADGSCFGNLTAVATATLPGIPCVIAAEDIADNAIGYCYTQGSYIEYAAVDDDVGSADIDRGDLLTITNGATYASEWSTGLRAVGLALEDAAASSLTTARTVDASSHLRYCIFWGGIPGMGCALG